MKKIKSFIMGHGSSGKAVAKSLEILKIVHPELAIESPEFLSRGQRLKNLIYNSVDITVLFICGPHATHALAIREADELGFRLIMSEKPACVSLEDCESLKKIKTPTFIFHGYRQMWGPQFIKKMMVNGEFGNLISIEGRYWQSSSAQKALSGKLDKSGWKNDVQLNGPFDTLIDLGCHWADLVFFLKGSLPIRSRGFLSYINSESAHRDTHVHLDFQFEDRCRAFGSVSKTFHGKGNHFEISILGAKQAATWLFANPDEVVLSQGAETKIIRRSDSILGSMQSPFHGTGWLEGYIEIIRQALLTITSVPGTKNTASAPSLQESINVIEVLLNTDFS